MRVLCFMTVLLALTVCGCAGRKAARTPAAGNPPAIQGEEKKLVVTPETALSGKVIKVNAQGRYVVLNYPIGRLPALEQRFNLYRQGVKVGEVKIVGPHSDEDIVADLLEGEAQLGDEARSN